MHAVPEVNTTKIMRTNVHSRRFIVDKSNGDVFPITHVTSNDGAASEALTDLGKADADTLTTIVGEEGPINQVLHLLSILGERSVQGVDGCITARKM